MAFPDANLCSLCRSIPFHDLPPFPDASLTRTSTGKRYLQKLFRRESRGDAPIPDPFGVRHHRDLASLRAASAAGCELCREIERFADGVLADMADVERWYSNYPELTPAPPDPSFELWVTRRGGMQRETKPHGGCGDAVADGFWVSTLSKSQASLSVYNVAAFGYCVDGDSHPLAADFRGRPILGTPVDDGLLDRVAGWVRECDERHDCRVADGAALPTRLLDLGGPAGSASSGVRLVEPAPGDRGRYAALSYCWGTDSNPYVTTRAALESRKSPGGIDVDALPSTFRDAIALARRLGIRYLWVDSLCICQDDIHDWERESARMAAVYSNAYLTVAATGSKDSNGGLFFPRPRRPYFRVGYEAAANGGSAAGGSASSSPAGMLIFPLDLQKEADRDKSITMHDEPLAERGWAFQERVLSPRVLHFASDQASFECIRGTVYEDGLRLPRRFNHVDHGKPGAAAAAAGGATPSEAPMRAPERSRHAIGQWYRIQGEYSRRKLTFARDKFPALSGIASLFAARLSVDGGGGYLAGLWRGEHMIESLCWQTPGARACDHASSDGGYLAPSWSWAAVDGYAASGFYHQHRDVARVLDGGVDVDGENPFGRVLDAWLRIEAPIVPLALSDAVQGPTGNMFLAMAPRGETGEVFCSYADFDTLDHSYHAMAETVRKMRLFALVMAGLLPVSWSEPEAESDVAASDYFCLIVTPVEGEGECAREGTPEKVKRVGYIFYPSKALTPDVLERSTRTLTFV
ncbi:hypothetical protein VTJ83DRAFT_110 [Remersonia thermophila]|uniref:Heterokaryon incompatibility domain-containing protein n=1 Tax=Remersonia thermophila TaxID=72144 RepID=A0ABR4DL32_9PEZI